MLSPRSEFQSRVAYYRRHKEFNPRLVEDVAEQAREHGFEYIVSCVSEEAKELHYKSRAVGCEIHRAHSFLRFQEKGDALVAKGDFEHDIVDLVLDHFMMRFPRKKIVLLTDGKAYVGERRIVSLDDPAKYALERTSQSRLAEPDWEAYYDSQYIEARRNRKLAMRHVPKKLWKQFGMKEGVKLDQGLITAKLSSFI